VGKPTRSGGDERKHHAHENFWRAWRPPFVLIAPGPCRAGLEGGRPGPSAREGAVQARAGFYRIGLPRSDLKVRLDGVDIKAGAGAGLLARLRGDGRRRRMVMGDLVLTGDEVNPVMQRLLEGGIEIHGAP